MLQNGLGYDAFMTRLENAAPSKSRSVVTVADVLGIHGNDANPHLWYDVPQLDRIATAIAAAFTRADPAHAVAYRRGLHRFERSLAPLRREVATIRTRFHGAPIAYTEPVPGYLVSAAGLRNLAPDSFTRLIEEGTEPSASAVGDHERARGAAPHPGAPLQQPGRLAPHRAAALSRAEGGHSRRADE